MGVARGGGKGGGGVVVGNALCEVKGEELGQPLHSRVEFRDGTEDLMEFGVCIEQARGRVQGQAEGCSAQGVDAHLGEGVEGGGVWEEEGGGAHTEARMVSRSRWAWDRSGGG